MITLVAQSNPSGFSSFLLLLFPVLVLAAVAAGA